MLEEDHLEKLLGAEYLLNLLLHQMMLEKEDHLD